MLGSPEIKITRKSHNLHGSNYGGTVKVTIFGQGQQAVVDAGETIKIQVGTVTAGLDGAHVFVTARPLDGDGNLIPVALPSPARPDWNVGGHVLPGRPRSTVLRTRYSNPNGFRWFIEKPIQPDAHGASAGVIVDVYVPDQ